MPNQRVLFIGTPFFGYFRQIIESFEARGYIVDHYDDRPSENAIIKGAIKVRPSAVRVMVQRHLDRILRETRRRQYDLIFVLNGKTLTAEFVQALRSSNPQTQAVLYLWDALSLYPHVLDFAALFDRRYTFDRRDALNHPQFELLPLFYTHDFEDLSHSPLSTDAYDLLNVCTAHPNRYAVMKRILPEFRTEGVRVYSYLYVNPLQFAYNRFHEPLFKDARLREFRFRPLNGSAYLELLRASRAVLDVNHSAQTGLTMRTIESIGAGRKLVTTNREVREYSFYDPSRIHVVDIAQFDVASIIDFINSPMEALDLRQYRALGIDRWVSTIIGSRAHHD
jgi:hypothetical protein